VECVLGSYSLHGVMHARNVIRLGVVCVVTAAVITLSIRFGCFCPTTLKTLRHVQDDVHIGTALMSLVRAPNNIKFADAEYAIMSRSNYAALTGVVMMSHRPLVIDVQHGLTNRLRALASAKAIAVRESRQLIIVWEQDKHCLAPLTELFSIISGFGFIVDDAELARSIVQRATFTRYDYMVDGTAAVKSAEETGLYIRTMDFIPWNGRYNGNHYDILHKLSGMTSPHVRAIISKYHDTLPTEMPATFHENLVGVHIRMVSRPLQDVPNLDANQLDRMELATAYRVSCHVKFFIRRMLLFPHTTHFFVSSDSAEAYANLIMHPELQTRVHYNDNHDCRDRSLHCVPYAAADLVLLSRTRFMLTSKWSAFSQVAANMGSVKSENGCDEPNGGWNWTGSKSEQNRQAIKYLQSQHYDDLPRVAAALKRLD
jgi:hypothetical protein